MPSIYQTTAHNVSDMVSTAIDGSLYLSAWKNFQRFKFPPAAKPKYYVAVMETFKLKNIGINARSALL
jgi:hypothetical protein